MNTDQHSDPLPMKDVLQWLDRREAELRGILQAGTSRVAQDLAASDGAVTDFKDLATEQSLLEVDQNLAEHAGRELEQIHLARRRVRDGAYGKCLDCGEQIDRRRLLLTPTVTRCASCQAAVEQHAEGSRRTGRP